MLHLLGDSYRWIYMSHASQCLVKADHKTAKNGNQVWLPDLTIQVKMQHDGYYTCI